MKPKTIAFDLDNTICSSIRRHHPEDILKVKPRQQWVGIMQELKRKGYKIIIFTSRDSCGANARNLTEEWLAKNNIPYDELITNKPNYDLFIGDRLISSHRGLWSAKFIDRWISFVSSSISKHTYHKR